MAVEFSNAWLVQWLSSGGASKGVPVKGKCSADRADSRDALSFTPAIAYTVSLGNGNTQGWAR